MDTAIGTNNEGSLVFGYSLEDTDTVDGADVFNGQGSVLWCNLRDAFPVEVVQMYQTLRSTAGLNYGMVEQRYESHQAKWPEAIWNEDAWFKYITPLTDPDPGKEPTDLYLPMLQGSKAEQRKWWLFNRFKYMDSKWNAGDALSQRIQLRGYAKANITVTPYSDIYPTVQYGSYFVSERGEHGQPTTLVCPLDNVNDTEIYVYSAPQLQSVGDLSGLKVGLADFSQATKLTSVVVGSSASGYTNPNLTSLSVGTNNLLATVDARNCTNLAGTVDLSGAKNIEHVYLAGTKVAACSLPVGGILKTLQLPSTVTNLTIRNQPNITTFALPDTSNITTLWVENCGDAIPVFDILDGMPANSRVRVVGFTALASTTSDVEDFFDLLDTMRGVDGNKAEAAGTISGLGSITGAWLKQMHDRYPDIEIGYEHITSTLTYRTWDGLTVLSTETIQDGGDGTYAGTPTRSSTAQYDYAFAGWSTYMDQYQADPDATKHITYDRDVYAAYLRTEKTFTVYFYNGSTLLQTVQNVPYGGTATYTGTTPVSPDGGPGDFQFTGWSPSNENVTANRSCYAQYIDVRTPLLRYLSGTLDEFESEGATTVKEYGFANQTILATAVLPYVTSVGAHAFMGDSSLTDIDLGANMNTRLPADFIGGCTSLNALVLRYDGVVALSGTLSGNSGISAGTGKVYVPANRLASYRAHTYWGQYQIDSIDNYVPTGGGNG